METNNKAMVTNYLNAILVGNRKEAGKICPDFIKICNSFKELYEQVKQLEYIKRIKSFLTISFFLFVSIASAQEGNTGKVKFGGRLMWDNAFFSQDDSLESVFGKLNNGSEFRKARLFNSGRIYHNIKYKIQLDFAGGMVNFKDVYIELTKLPVAGNLRMGHFKEPFRLESVTGSKYITFMERALPIDFLPERNTGIMIYKNLPQKRLSWQAGFFRSADGAGNDKQADNGYNITARITGLPVYNEEKRQLLYLGLAYSYRKNKSREYKIESRPESHLANKYVSTGTISDVDNTRVLGTEAALVLGPFSVQGEFVQSSVVSNTNYTFFSFYTQVSYFITGENRNYKNSYAGFSRVSPKKNFGSEGGAGAWEFALRYSGTNLNNGAINGGQLNDLTFGINWYLNPSTRIMANYIFVQRKDIGNAGIFQIRTQIDF